MGDEKSKADDFESLRYALAALSPGLLAKISAVFDLSTVPRPGQRPNPAAEMALLEAGTSLIITNPTAAEPFFEMAELLAEIREAFDEREDKRH